MIPFELDYIRAESAAEAVEIWSRERAAGRQVRYFGGGTEFTTLARENKIHADVVVDYKRVPEARDHGSSGDGPGHMTWGAALRLNEIVDTNRCGLVSRCCAGVADRTVRNSITLGGNIAGMLPYREAVLPFLLFDGTMTTIGPAGEQTTPVADRFDKKMNVAEGDLLLRVSLDASMCDGVEHGGVTASDRGWGPLESWATGPRGGWYYTRRTREPRLDYPLVTLVLARLDGAWRLASSGAMGYPLRMAAAETVLNGVTVGDIATMSERDRLTLAAHALEAERVQFRKDMRGSREYRREMTIRSLADGVARLADAQDHGETR
ncbi:MAG: FAD binding domain-containing protein [Spirochaeta sp.]|jgi:CO/xanthine dehydrogenase FAD-binding subunit|nr:FAD binding domain-containing protein [Spirochaeta sp.]